MSEEETRAMLTVCLLAACADGDKHMRERAQIEQVAESLARDRQIRAPGLYQEVLQRRIQLADVSPRLSNPGTRVLAYDMAVGVCESDGRASDDERVFLARLRDALDQGSNRFADEAGALMGAPLDIEVPTYAGADVNHALVSALSGADVGSAPTAPRRAGSLTSVQINRKVLDAALLTGALNLLRETLATLAIIPLQMRLVDQLGQCYGYELDSGHVKDLMATVGLGVTSQYLALAGSQLLSGLPQGLGRTVTGSGASFASTFALGHVADQYYGGGRTLNASALRDAYERIWLHGHQNQRHYLSYMQDLAQGLPNVLSLQMHRSG